MQPDTETPRALPTLAERLEAVLSSTHPADEAPLSDAVVAARLAPFSDSLSENDIAQLREGSVTKLGDIHGEQLAYVLGVKHDFFISDDPEYVGTTIRDLSRLKSLRDSWRGTPSWVTSSFRPGMLDEVDGQRWVTPNQRFVAPPDDERS